VRSVKVGDRVLGLTSASAFAEQVVDDENRFLVLPPDFDLTIAAAFSVTHGTAHVGLDYRARLQPGESLLVLGAAGGTGLAAIEIGKRMGATVIAAAGTAEKLALCQARGADHAIDYSREDLRARVLDITAGRGVNVVFDPVGGTAARAALRCMAFGGRIL